MRSTVAAPMPRAGTLMTRFTDSESAGFTKVRR